MASSINLNLATHCQISLNLDIKIKAGGREGVGGGGDITISLRSRYFKFEKSRLTIVPDSKQELEYQFSSFYQKVSHVLYLV